jgi:hypothetical protein
MVDDRSINVGGNVSGSILITGHNSVATLTATALPPAAAVDITAVLAQLRALMTATPTSATPRIDLELGDASVEAVRPEPKRAKIAGALERAVDAFKGTAEFAGSAGKIADLVTKAAGWIGEADLGGLLATVGLTL